MFVKRCWPAPMSTMATNVSGTFVAIDRKSTRLNSSHEWISYAVFCLKKKKEIDKQLLGKQLSHADIARPTSTRISYATGRVNCSSRMVADSSVVTGPHDIPVRVYA